MKRMRIDFQNLVNRHDAYLLSVRADVFQWMLKTGWEYRDRHGVFELLYGLSGYGAQTYYADYGLSDFSSMASFLKAAFVRAIVADDVSADVKWWREKERIALGRYRMLMLPDNTISYPAVRDVLDYKGYLMTVELNAFHPAAMKINHILLSPNREGWKAILNYGYADDNSGWDYPLHDERLGFADSVYAAAAKLKQLTGESA